jgi:hypothetical protein
MVYDLANGDVLRINDVNRMDLYTCLFALSIKNERSIIESKINTAIETKYKSK